jgi:uncharacterized membrane protein
VVASEFVTVLVLDIVLAAVCAALPRLTRPGIFFAVTVGREFGSSARGRRIVRRYRLGVAASLALAVGVLVVGDAIRLPGLLPASVGVVLVGFLIAFLAARRRVLPSAASAATAREALLVPHRDLLPGGMPAQLGPFALLVAVGGYLAAHWDRVPARVPMHWGPAGTPDRWASRGVAGVSAPLLVAAVTCGLLVGTAFMIQRFARRVDSTGAAAERESRFRRTMLWALLGSEYFVAALQGYVSLIPLLSRTPAPTFPLVPVLVASLVFVVVLLVVLVRTGQGGTRLRGVGEERGGAVGDRTPDACWKAGLFYYNPDDPALFVEKRFGIGYTFNFANVWAWVILAAILVVPTVLAVVLAHAATAP